MAQEGLQSCLAFLAQAPVTFWLGLLALIVGAFVYWALDCYFLQAILGTFSVTVDQGAASPVTELVNESCVCLKKRYRSTPWLCSPHLQTIYLHFDPWTPVVRYRREIFTLPDGGSAGLDWCGPDQPMTPTVVIIPGLTSDSNSSYNRYLVADITAKGWRSVIINHRGLGGVSLTSDTFYNAGHTSDIRVVLKSIKSRIPSAPLALVGSSLGANMVIKFLGEEGADSPVWGAVAIGCPFDLLVCDRFMNRTTVQRLWNAGLAHGMREFAELHKEPFSKVVDFSHLQLARTLREFDDRITRFTANYETVDTYYRRCSSAPYVPAVQTPLLAMSTLDDPICTKESIPWDECRLNPYVVLATVPRGGHLAIYDGWLARRLWWTKPCVEFLSGIFERGYKGLEPVVANGSSVTAKLPLVQNGWAAETCNGVTETLLETETKSAFSSKASLKPNGVLSPLSVNSLKHCAEKSIRRLEKKASQKTEHKMNGHATPNAYLTPLIMKSTQHTEEKCPLPAEKKVVRKDEMLHKKMNGFSHMNGLPGREHLQPFETPSKAQESEVTPKGLSAKRVVIDFTDEAQAAAVEAFLSEILDQMSGVASSPQSSLSSKSSVHEAALAATSAAASASAVAAAAAAVVRSASAAALAVRNSETLAVQNPKSQKPEKKDSKYLELMRCYERVLGQGHANTWLLAYVAVAVSVPLFGSLQKMQGMQGLNARGRMLKLTKGLK